MELIELFVWLRDALLPRNMMSGCRVRKRAGPIVSLPMAWMRRGWPRRDVKKMAPCFVMPAR